MCYRTELGVYSTLEHLAEVILSLYKELSSAVRTFGVRDIKPMVRRSEPDHLGFNLACCSLISPRPLFCWSSAFGAWAITECTGAQDRAAKFSTLQGSILSLPAFWLAESPLGCIMQTKKSFKENSRFLIKVSGPMGVFLAIKTLLWVDSPQSGMMDPSNRIFWDWVERAQTTEWNYSPVE